MGPDFFQRAVAVGTFIVAILGSLAPPAHSEHGIAMYGTPALPPDFVSLPYSNPDAPKGGRAVFGSVGSFDSLNPFVLKGNVPWQLRYWAYETLLARSWDEPFTLYGLLAESVETAPDRSWVEFTLREEARFSDGSPVTIEDVIWSYETLGTQGHLRYRGFWSKIDTIEQTGPRNLRLTFNQADRELALIAGLRPILKKAQWEGKDFVNSGLSEAPIGTAAYVVDKVDAGRSLTLRRNPDYWGHNLPFRRGTQNFDELRIEFFGDGDVLFEAFKAGEVTVLREFNARAWDTNYDFPAAQAGDVIKTEIPHDRPSGMTGLVMNTRRAPFDDWRVREAMLLAFNFEFITDTVTGGAQTRITSYFSNSQLAMQAGPASEAERALLQPFAQDLPPGTLEGYVLPEGDGTARNRANLRRAMALLQEAGWQVVDGRLQNSAGAPFDVTVLLRQGATDYKAIIELYAAALKRLGISLRAELVDSAQFAARETELDFDMMTFRRDLSLSPGNEQRLYWGSAVADTPGTRNLMGASSPAIDAMIDRMLTAEDPESFRSAARALDRVLTAGRYVIPIWQFDIGRVAHDRRIHTPGVYPIYGDRPGLIADTWWYSED